MALPDLQTPTRLSTAEFERITTLPENRERRLELLEGAISDMVSNDRSSELAGAVLAHLYIYLQQHPIGRVLGADGGYALGASRLIPDVSFIHRDRQAAASGIAWNPTPPNLVVEVLSPTDRTGDVVAKLRIYQQADVLVWLVDPEGRTLTVLPPAGLPTVLHAGDTLEGGDLLPGFCLPLHILFPED